MKKLWFIFLFFLVFSFSPKPACASNWVNIGQDIDDQFNWYMDKDSIQLRNGILTMWIKLTYSDGASDTVFFYFDLSNRTMAPGDAYKLDSNGKTIDYDYVPVDSLRFRPIPPDSLFEVIFEEFSRVQQPRKANSHKYM